MGIQKRCNVAAEDFSHLLHTIHLPPPVQISDDCWKLVRALLAVDPALRPSLSDIATHPWVAASTPAELLRVNDDLLSQARDAPAAA